MEGGGWIRSDYLPVNWRCKLIGEKKTTYNFLTAEGDMVKGSEAARNLVFRSDKFSQEEREGLRIFIDIQSVMIRSKSYDWNENDESIPRGWKSRMGGSKQFF